MIGFDSETFLIQPGQQFPPMVCATFAGDPALPSIMHARDTTTPDAIRYAYDRGLVGANTAFDSGVSMAAWPELTPAIFDAYENDRVECVQTRQKLIDIGLGCYRGFKAIGGQLRKLGYSLDDLTQRHLGIQLDKDGPWRLRYGTLDQVPLDWWPQAAKDYAIGDARATLAVREAQQPYAHLLADQFRQTRYDFALKLTAGWGLRTDPDGVAFFADAIDRHHAHLGGILREWGLVKADGVRDTKAAAAEMVRHCEAEGLPVLRTDPSPKFPNGQVSLSTDTCLESGSDRLKVYGEYSRIMAVKSKDLEFLIRGTREPLHCRYEVLVESGRTSSSKPNIQNLRRIPGIREAFIPAAGSVFAVADYGGLELATMAQACIELVGYSRLADLLNEGIDPHLYFACKMLRVTYEDGRARLKPANGADPDKEIVNARQTGKVFLFGSPGGLGAATMVDYARALYGIVLTEDQCKQLKDLWLHLFPEFRDYFKVVNSMVIQGRGVGQLYTGRWRGSVTYTSACNTFFQGLGADVAKRAGWAIVRQCWGIDRGPLNGCRPVAFIHDEWVLECPEGYAAEACEELRRVMIREAGVLLTGVRIDVEHLLTRRLSKKAKPVRDASGRLVPWDRPYRECLLGKDGALVLS